MNSLIEAKRTNRPPEKEIPFSISQLMTTEGMDKKSTVLDPKVGSVFYLSQKGARRVSKVTLISRLGIRIPPGTGLKYLGSAVDNQATCFFGIPERPGALLTITSNDPMFTRMEVPENR